jgi:phosphoketolase
MAETSEAHCAETQAGQGNSAVAPDVVTAGCVDVPTLETLAAVCNMREHVRGYQEEGTVTTPFDTTVLNDLDRFHLAMDTIDRLPQTGDKGSYLEQQLKDRLIEHRQYINKCGEDMPEIRNWQWSALPGSTEKQS